MTGGERSLANRRAALLRHAHMTPEQARAQGRAGQAGLEARWLAEIDPDGLLTPAERQVRLERARRAHMIALSQKAQRARKEARP